MKKVIEHKGYKISRDPAMGLWTIALSGKGSVPKKLRGSYTSDKLAILAVDGYKATSEVKQNESSSTD